jgi:hypothetical protein
MKNYFNPLKTQLGEENAVEMVVEIAEITESEIFEKVRNYLTNKGINPDEEHLGEIVSDICHYMYFNEIKQ